MTNDHGDETASQLLTLVEMFDDGGEFTVRNIQSKFGVCEPTARRYLEFAKDHRSLAFDRPSREKVWHIDRVHLDAFANLDEAVGLAFAVKALEELEELEGTPYLERLKKMAVRARTALGTEARAKLDRLQDSGLVEAVGETLAVQPEPGQPNDGEQQPDQGLQNPNPASKLQYLPPEVGVRLVNDIDADDGARFAAEPPAYRGSRDTEASDDARISRLADQLSKLRIVGLLCAFLRVHAGEHRHEPDSASRRRRASLVVDS